MAGCDTTIPVPLWKNSYFSLLPENILSADHSLSYLKWEIYNATMITSAIPAIMRGNSILFPFSAASDCGTVAAFSRSSFFSLAPVLDHSTCRCLFFRIDIDFLTEIIHRQQEIPMFSGSDLLFVRRQFFSIRRRTFHFLCVFCIITTNTFVILSISTAILFLLSSCIN